MTLDDLDDELDLVFGFDRDTLFENLGTVYITKDTHRYCRGRENPIPYTSVSEVINKYKIPYNANYWSKYKAYQRIIMNRIALENPRIVESGLEKRSKAHIKELLLEYAINNAPNIDSPGFTTLEDIDALNYAIDRDKINSQEMFSQREIILDSWKNKKDTASNKGNVYHRGREINAINAGYEFNAFDLKEYTLHLNELLRAYKIEEGAHSTREEALIWGLDFSDEKRVITDDPYNDLPDGFYPELIISDDEYKVAGTADRVFFETILGQRFVDIDDYKTNQDIPKKSFYVRGQGYKMMNYPVNHLMDCKHSYYNLQTSIYAYLLERKGFIVRKTGYHHLNALNECEYLRQEAKDVLEDFSNMKQENNFDNNKI